MNNNIQSPNWLNLLLNIYRLSHGWIQISISDRCDIINERGIYLSHSYSIPALSICQKMRSCILHIYQQLSLAENLINKKSHFDIFSFPEEYEFSYCSHTYHGVHNYHKI